MPELTLAAAAEALRTRQLSPVELTGSVLARLDEVEPRLNAYAAVAAEQARKSAREAEREIAAGHYRGPLHGIPFGLKDLIDAEGLPIAHAARACARATGRPPTVRWPPVSARPERCSSARPTHTSSATG